MSYAANCGDQYRRSAEYVDKVLKSPKPGDPPIEQRTMFELVVNLKLPALRPGSSDCLVWGSLLSPTE